MRRVQQMDRPASVGIRDHSNQQRPCSYPVVAATRVAEGEPSVTKTLHLPPRSGDRMDNFVKQITTCILLLNDVLTHEFGEGRGYVIQGFPSGF